MGFWTLYMGIEGGGGEAAPEEPVAGGDLYLRRTVGANPVYFAKRYVTQS